MFIEEEKYKNNIGVYKIVNLLNGRVYVGQTKEKFQRRFCFHRWKLRKGSHDNKYLQNAWNKYGEDNFVFEVIEVLSINEIDEREKYWIKYYREQPEGCYSIQDGGQPKNLGVYVSVESRKRVGELNRQRLLGSKLSQETKQKMSNVRKGKRVLRHNDSLTDEQAIQIKTLFVKGKSSREIQEITNIPYKPINNILSKNSYCTLFVEGWDDFYAKHQEEKNFRKNRGKLIEQELLLGSSIKEVALKYCLHETTIKYYLRKINKLQDNSVPSLRK